MYSAQKQAELIWKSEKSGKGDERVTESEWGLGVGVRVLLGVWNIVFLNWWKFIELYLDDLETLL